FRSWPRPPTPRSARRPRAVRLVQPSRRLAGRIKSLGAAGLLHEFAPEQDEPSAWGPFSPGTGLLHPQTPRATVDVGFHPRTRLPPTMLRHNRIRATKSHETQQHSRYTHAMRCNASKRGFL